MLHSQKHLKKCTKIFSEVRQPNKLDWCVLHPHLFIPWKNQAENMFIYRVMANFISPLCKSMYSQGMAGCVACHLVIFWAEQHCSWPEMDTQKNINTNFHSKCIINLLTLSLYTLKTPQNKKKNSKNSKTYSTWYSQAVTHPSTNQARRCLTSVIRREPVFST